MEADSTESSVSAEYNDNTAWSATDGRVSLQIVPNLTGFRSNSTVSSALCFDSVLSTIDLTLLIGNLALSMGAAVASPSLEELRRTNQKRGQFASFKPAK